MLVRADESWHRVLTAAGAAQFGIRPNRWDMLGHVGTRWDTLGHSGTWWHTLGHAGTCWDTLEPRS